MKRRTVWMASATLLVMPMAAQAYTSKSGSQMRTFPDSSISILDGSLLTQTKLCPKSERQTPDTKPT